MMTDDDDDDDDDDADDDDDDDDDDADENDDAFCCRNPTLQLAPFNVRVCVERPAGERHILIELYKRCMVQRRA